MLCVNCDDYKRAFAGRPMSDKKPQ